MKDRSPPLISVLMCNYNYGNYIGEAIESVLDQDYKNIEIIIVDDKSTDNSLEVIDSYTQKNPNIKFVLKAKNKNEGICYARNDALRMANGEYILFLDSDDNIPSNYISKFYEVALTKKADVVYGDYEYFGSASGKSNFPSYNIDELIISNYINICTLVKRDRVGGNKFDIALNRKSHEDYDFWLGLAFEGLKFVKAEGVYLQYRIKDSSRNGNISTIEQQVSDFIKTWQYIIGKYKNKYSEKIPENYMYKQMMYQVNHIGKARQELEYKINTNLLPQIANNEERIKELTNTINDLQNKISSTENSKEYRVGRILLTPIRKTIKSFREFKNIFMKGSK